jgi:sarcosine oxidase subunit delta
MILVPCPHCGPRNASEFKWCGEARTRPDPNHTTTAEWREYLYMRSNTAGWTVETWFHRAGCRMHFTAERNTVSNEIRTVEVSVTKVPVVETEASSGLVNGLDTSVAGLLPERPR